MHHPKILITGATGYVGGRLRRRLETQGYFVRCLVRSKGSVPLSVPKNAEYLVGCVTDKATLNKALEGIDVAYYLVPSFSKADRDIANQFAEAAARAKIQKIIYLNGLANTYEMDLSPHLKNRQEVGHILRANSSEVQVIEFRTSLVIGSGSVSFEMIRALVEKFSIILAPKWVMTEAQPIAIDDLLLYLIRAIDCPLEGNPIFTIGGKDRVSYGGLIKEYADKKDLKRFLIPIPLLVPSLSGLWLALVTPLYVRVGKQVAESAIATAVVHDPLAAHVFEMKPIGYKEALARAIKNEDDEVPETRWNDAASAGIGIRDWSREHFGGRFLNLKQKIVPYSPEQAFQPIVKIGGRTGYYSLNWIWKIRGLIDLLAGGVGFRRGRRHPKDLRPGDVIDFWRVASYLPNQHLKLLAEAKTPGRGILEFTIVPHKDGSEITQKAIFDPIGVPGILYWYLFYPFHCYVFKRMFREIIRKMGEPV